MSVDRNGDRHDSKGRYAPQAHARADGDCELDLGPSFSVAVSFFHEVEPMFLDHPTCYGVHTNTRVLRIFCKIEVMMNAMPNEPLVTADAYSGWVVDAAGHWRYTDNRDDIHRDIETVVLRDIEPLGIWQHRDDALDFVRFVQRAVDEYASTIEVPDIL